MAVCQYSQFSFYFSDADRINRISLVRGRVTLLTLLTTCTKSPHLRISLQLFHAIKDYFLLSEGKNGAIWNYQADYRLPGSCASFWWCLLFMSFHFRVIIQCSLQFVFMIINMNQILVTCKISFLFRFGTPGLPGRNFVGSNLGKRRIRSEEE